MAWEKFLGKGEGISTVAGEIAHFVETKLVERGFPSDKLDEALDKIKSDIYSGEDEIWSEEITPSAEEKAEEIIEENIKELEAIAGKKLEEVV